MLCKPLPKGQGPGVGFSVVADNLLAATHSLLMQARRTLALALALTLTLTPTLTLTLTHTLPLPLTRSSCRRASRT